MKISSILATKGMNVVTIRPDRSVREAVAVLVQHNIGALVVVDEAGKPMGILSERDIVRALASRDDALIQSVKQVMTAPVIATTPQDDLTAVMQTMTEKRFRHLPIVDRGELAGIVSIGDVVKAQLDEYRGAIDTLQMQIIGEES